MFVLGVFASITTTFVAQFLQQSAQQSQLVYQRRLDLLTQVLEFHNTSVRDRSRKLEVVAEFFDRRVEIEEEDYAGQLKWSRELQALLSDYRKAEDAYLSKMAMYVPLVGAVFEVDAKGLLVDPDRDAVDSEEIGPPDLSGMSPSEMQIAFVEWSRQMYSKMPELLSKMLVTLDNERERVNEELTGLANVLRPSSGPRLWL